MKTVIVLTNQTKSASSKPVLLLTNQKPNPQQVKTTAPRPHEPQVKKPPNFFRSLDHLSKKKPKRFELNQDLNLTDVLSSGGEGAVYQTHQRNIVAKIYHDPGKRNIDKKVEFLASIDFDIENIAKPEALIYKNGKFQGFTMKNLSGYKTLFFITTTARNDFFHAKLNYKFVLSLAIKITDTIARLHDMGIVIGDIKLQNIMVNPEGDICLVDFDSIQANQIFLCHTRTFEYQPPETHHDSGFTNKLRFWHYDAYSTAVLIFQLLTLGTHPYQARNLGTLEECIKRQYYQYPLPMYDDSLKSNQFIILEIHEIIAKHFSHHLRKYFYNTFHARGFYYKQENRKPVRHLHQVLINELNGRNS